MRHPSEGVLRRLVDEPAGVPVRNESARPLLRFRGRYVDESGRPLPRP